MLRAVPGPGGQRVTDAVDVDAEADPVESGTALVENPAYDPNDPASPRWVRGTVDGGSGGGVVYAGDPPSAPTEGLVWIDATGIGVNHDGSRP